MKTLITIITYLSMLFQQECNDLTTSANKVKTKGIVLNNSKPIKIHDIPIYAIWDSCFFGNPISEWVTHPLEKVFDSSIEITDYMPTDTSLVTYPQPKIFQPQSSRNNLYYKYFIRLGVLDSEIVINDMWTYDTALIKKDSIPIDTSDKPVYYDSATIVPKATGDNSRGRYEIFNSDYDSTHKIPKVNGKAFPHIIMVYPTTGHNDIPPFEIIPKIDTTLRKFTIKAKKNL